MWYIHTMEYYSAIERNEVLICATNRTKLGNIMLSERTQTPKDQVLYDYEMSRMGKPIETK